MKPTIIFMGTPEFAVPTLEKLNENFNVKAVVTVPDKPQGRGLKLIPSPVKLKALKLGLDLFQPEKLKDELFIKQIENINPDIICVVAFRILPKEVFSLSKLGTFNIHASLLPKYRGAAPINWAIINGEKTTGLTSFLIQEKVDTGDVLLYRKVKIEENMTAGELHDLLMPLSADLAVETCNLLISGKFTPIQQNNDLASPAPKLFAENLKIEWSNNSYNLVNLINGTSPIPCSWTIWNNKKLKLYKAKIYNIKLKPGNFIIDYDKLIIGCLDGSLEILELQLEGKKAMKTTDFIRGYRGEKYGKFD